MRRAVPGGELPPDACATLDRLLDELPAWGCFLHELCGSPLEDRIVGVAEPLLAGNDEIAAALDARGLPSRRAWAPGMVFDTKLAPAELSIFSFGMAHKLPVAHYVRLRELLEADGRSYALYFSNASHETATIGDEERVFAAMRELFPRNLFFLGHLSDVAIYNWMRDTTFFAAFFRDGARANNTSIASAMEHGAVVITNLDEHSPPALRHRGNVIDLNRAEGLPSDPLEFGRLSVRAIETARERDWDALVQIVSAKAAVVRGPKARRASRPRRRAPRRRSAPSASKPPSPRSASLAAVTTKRPESARRTVAMRPWTRTVASTDSSYSCSSHSAAGRFSATMNVPSCSIVRHSGSANHKESVPSAVTRHLTSESG